ncbi:Hypothetical predicted protein [Paramuricea clavata]|uniref:Uncharacterized protein n=1 Tax=Paramuricea clavata TaxID=317549 RepID=A0A6S7KE71_PARCT|nr:Hypothetical predicted protein [Paramuricea clavata]
MYYYHIAFPTPCKDCKGSDNFFPDLFTKLWKQLILQLPESCSDEHFNSNSLPVPLWGESKNLFQLLPVLRQSSNEQIPGKEWFNFAEFMHHDLFLETLLNELDNVNWNELDYAEIIAEQLHNNADSITDKLNFMNIYWLTCGHAQCIESSDNTAIHGALKRLQRWNTALITFVCDSDILCERDFTDSWFQIQNIYVVTQDEKLLQDNNIVWQGSLECLQNDKNEENYDWHLSRMMCKSAQSSEASLSNSKEDRISDHQVLADNIKVICELPKSAVPFWKIFPSQFVLYHNSLLKRVFQLQETSGLDFETLSENKDTLLLSSIAICARKHQVRTTKDWMEFITSESNTSDHDKMQTKFPVIETHHLVSYPVEPGIFLAYFIRPEDSFINLHSSLAIYQAIFPCAEKEKATLYEDTEERRWLQLLDAIESSQKSPLKSQFSLAVHLDASEMLKHFTKDGKPMKKNLKSLLKQIEEKRKISPSKQTEIEKRHETVAGVEYCLDKISAVSSSAKLLPKHETLSICNTPKTLAKAKLQDVKRKASKTTDDGTSDASRSHTLEQLEQTRKKRPENRERSNEQRNKESVVKPDPSAEGSKKKRRSFDGNETATDTNTKEKRSDRHKRRLARVVKRALIKYGVDPAEEYFTTCSERLYYLCKSFLKDLKTSEGLNNEMKRLAELNVATVVEFEKRQHVSRAGEKPQSNTTTNS